MMEENKRKSGVTTGEKMRSRASVQEVIAVLFISVKGCDCLANVCLCIAFPYKLSVSNYRNWFWVLFVLNKTWNIFLATSPSSNMP